MRNMLTDEEIEAMIEEYEYKKYGPALTADQEEAIDTLLDMLYPERLAYLDNGPEETGDEIDERWIREMSDPGIEYDEPMTEEERMECECIRNAAIAEEKERLLKHEEFMRNMEEYDKMTREKYPGMSGAEIFAARFEAHRIDKEQVIRKQ
jgi:hypothetical protein